MRRRDFITLLGVAAWPVAARAQRPRLPVVGVLSVSTPQSSALRLDAFRQGLNEYGYVEGQNVVLELRWGDGRYDRLPDLARDLVRREVSVIATPGNTAATLAAKAATSTIPVVFGVGEDPVKLGLVASLNRPGGNATGINFFTTELVAKRLGLLRELVPSATRIAVLVNPTNPTVETIVGEVKAAARSLAQQVDFLSAATAEEIDAAFAKLASDRQSALLVCPDPFFLSRRAQLATLSSRHAVSTMAAARPYSEAGGLMSYGTNLSEMFRQVGAYTGRILKGANPADLPVIQSTKFEFVINLTTAKALGLTIPPTLLALADEVIE